MQDRFICPEEIAAWEHKLSERNLCRMYGAAETPRDPRREVMEDYRRHRMTVYGYSHEEKWIRKYTMRQFRRRMKARLYDETFYRPVNHDHKTYGWLTW